MILTNNIVNAQHDADSLKNILLVWNLSDDFNEKTVEYNDSNLILFHNSNLDKKHSILSTNLGNIGSANITDEFSKRFDNFNNRFSFNIPYYTYLKNSQNVNFFNTRRPYTSIMHTTSSKINDIQTIDFIHTQNINPNFNFAINFDFVSSLGQYLNQQAKISTIGISTNFKKKRYVLYTSFAHNKISNKDAGGYVEADGINLAVPQPFLENASTNILDQELSITNKYLFGKYKNLSYKDSIIKVLEPSISISHNVTLFREYRIYSDEESVSGLYYSNYFFQDEITFDSIGQRGITNKIEIGTDANFEEKNKFGFSLIYDGTIQQIFNFKDYIFLENLNSFFENSISGELFANINSKTSINGYGKYYASGYREGDLRISLDIKRFLFKKYPKTFIWINLKYTDQKPDYFIQRFYSNHFFWENEFANTQLFEGNLILNFSENDLKASFYAGLIKNYNYYGLSENQIAPMEFADDIYILSGSLEKNFEFRRLNIHNKVIWQQSSADSVIALPIIGGYHSTYLKFNYKENTLLIHFGFDVYYTTPYKAKSFNPAIGQFYFENDSSKITGNYPYITIFANLKIKKNVQLYIKFEHVNSTFMFDRFPTYINNYPLNGRLFRFGVRWTFKN